MLIASEQLRRQGFTVTTVHPKLYELQDWFPKHRFLDGWKPEKGSWIIAENDNSKKIGALKENFREDLSVFYPTYFPYKHGPLFHLDRAFDPQCTMAKNIAAATASLLGIECTSRENGIEPPSHLTHRLHRNRVLIHHTSSAKEKNWLKEKYDEVAEGLRARVFEPVFIPEFATLSDLAAFVYESGFVVGNDSLVGHLASNLNIPTLIVADKAERMHLWRPGWLEGSVITLSEWTPSWRFFERNWQYFISPERVLKNFDRLSHSF